MTRCSKVPSFKYCHPSKKRPDCDLPKSKWPQDAQCLAWWTWFTRQTPPPSTSHSQPSRSPLKPAHQKLFQGNHPQSSSMINYRKITIQDDIHCGNTDMNDSLFHRMFQTYFPHKNLDQYLSWEPLGTVGSSLADVFAWKLKLKWLRVSSVKCSKYGSTEYNRKEYSTSKSSGYWAALWQTRCSCSIGSWRLKRRLTMDLCLRCTRSGVKQ